MRPAPLLVAFLAVCQAAVGELEVAARLDLPPAGLAITRQGRKFVSLHQAFEPVDRVAEITGANTVRTFPLEGLDSVLGIHAGSDGLIWMLDNGLRGNKPPTLAAWDSISGKLAFTIDLPPPATLPTSCPTDMALDTEHHAVYIADPASGPDAALIVVNLETLVARRVLKGAKCVVPEDVDLVIDGHAVEMRKPDGTSAKARIGVTAIALNPFSVWLYFGPLNGKSLYRVRTQDILDKFMEPSDLEAAVERYSDKPVGGAIAIDGAQTIYAADISANGFGRIGTDRKYQLVATDPKLRWPDDVSIGPDGAVYLVASQLQFSKTYGGAQEPETPFLIFKWQTPETSAAVLPPDQQDSPPDMVPEGVKSSPPPKPAFTARPNPPVETVRERPGRSFSNPGGLPTRDSAPLPDLNTYAAPGFPFPSVGGPSAPAPASPLEQTPAEPVQPAPNGQTSSPPTAPVPQIPTNPLAGFPFDDARNPPSAVAPAPAPASRQDVQTLSRDPATSVPAPVDPVTGLPFDLKQPEIPANAAPVGNGGLNSPADSTNSADSSPFTPSSEARPVPLGAASPEPQYDYSTKPGTVFEFVPEGSE